MKIHYLSSKRFHLNAIKDAYANFEDSEPTVSHIFREKHRFLANRTFGEAFYQAIRKHCWSKPFNQVLEIGGGIGTFAKSFIKEWVRSSKTTPKTYKIIELSPNLLQSQRKLLNAYPDIVQLIQADAQHLPLENNSFNGLVIANEMIADLDAWKISRKRGDILGNKMKRFRCMGKQSKHFNPQLVRQYLRRYPDFSFLPFRSVLFPFGVVLLLEKLYRAVEEESRIILTEYFDLYGGGKVYPFHQHKECSFSLDLVCHLAREIGFSVRTLSLIDFMNIHVTEPVASRAFLTFVRDQLGHDVSRTLPYQLKNLSKLLGLKNKNIYDGFFSRVELQNHVMDMHVMMLTKRRNLSPSDFNGQLVCNKEPETLTLKSKNGERFLVIAHPFRSHQLNNSGVRIWNQIDGKKSARDIASALAHGYKISPKRALKDTLDYLKTLHRCHYIYTSTVQN